MKTAPIVLFVYNRPWHTQQTVEALQKNKLAQVSELFIYSDAAKNDQASEDVEAVREYIETIKGFKKVTLIKREENWGLAASIIDGVTKIVNEYGKIIVLEDDLVTGPYFLNFMNDALDFYKDEQKVWHISGWNIELGKNLKEKAYLWRVMECWGWATWQENWEFFNKKVATNYCNDMSPEDVYRFNLDGHMNYYTQVIGNRKKIINTWAVFWYATIFKHNGLCLSPCQRLLINIGLDGSGVNCGKSKLVQNDVYQGVIENLPQRIEENSTVVDEIKKYYKKMTVFNRVKKLVKKSIAKLGL